MRSMTGIGTGIAREGDVTIRVDVRSVNHRFLDIALKLPSSLSDSEVALRKKLSDSLDRGRVSVSVDLELAKSELEIRVNDEFLDSYMKRSRAVAKKYGLSDEMTVHQLLSMPDAMILCEAEVPATTLDELLNSAVDQAMKGYDTMRSNEGAALAREMNGRLETMRVSLKTVGEHAEQVPQEIQQRLNDRLAKLGAADAVDPTRLAGEIALLADKANITEEIERLDSHLTQYGEAMGSDKPVAKRLGFLLQEMHREVNTIGSKTTHLEITRAVLQLKEEIESLREQIQNLE